MEEESVSRRRALVALDDDRLLELLRRQEEEARRHWFARLETVQEITDRGLAAKHAATSVATLLRAVLQLSLTEANARVLAAQALLGQRAVSGEVLEPAAPVTADACAEGAIGSEHVRVIEKTIRTLPVDSRAEAEAFLATQARVYDSSTLGKIAARLKATLDPDGPEPVQEPEAVREFSWYRDPDGTCRFRGVLDAEAAAMLRAAIEPLAKPHVVDGKRDDRSAARRNADALIEIIRRALASGRLPSRPNLIITISLDNLRNRKGTALLDDGSTITAGEARRHALRREHHPRRPRHRLRTPRRRQGQPHRNPSHPPSTYRPRPRTHLPRLRPTTHLVPSPPCGRVGTR